MAAIRKAASLLIFLTLTLVLSLAPANPSSLARASQDPASDGPSGPKIASNLGFLLSLQSQDISLDPDSSLSQELASIRASGAIQVSARFAHELSPAERADIEALGVEFETVAGQLAHLGPFYGVSVPTGAVEDLAAHPLAVWLEAAWWPVVPVPLDLSVSYAPASFTYVNAPAVWSTFSPYTALPLSGHGVMVANFDTGVDVRHPAFLSGTFGTGYTNWDTNGDFVFTPGVDQIGGVILRYWNAAGDPNNTGGFDVTQDWVYGDANNNTVYDWSETVYMAYDMNSNNVLDWSEPLIDRGTLGTGIPNSKIAATLNAGGVQRTRGTDLHLTAADTSGHGTGVTGILGAGAAHWNTGPVWPLARRYTGMAPDTDLLVADRLNNTDTAYMTWATGMGAQVMLHELGGWVQTYMDGSSNYEQMIDQASAQGIVQVVPTGNLHCGTAGCNPRHLQYTVPGSATTNYQFNVPATPSMNNIWTSLLWLNPANNVTIQLTTPTGGAGNTVSLPCVAAGSGWQYVNTADGHQVGCERALDSGRGTALYNIWIARSPIVIGNWTMAMTNPGASAQTTNFYIADDSVNAWSFGAGWITAGGQEKYTATWPSTCDSCLGVASYATRANVVGTVGALSWFSGRGPRFFDGARIVDVAAPGHYDIITPQSQAVSGSVGSYHGTFGGTSAAGPHAAGLAALLYQYANGNTNATQVADAIMRGALSDTFTGAVPNDNWGFGKLRSFEALLNLFSDLGDAPASANNTGQNMDAYPGVQANFPTVYAAIVPGPFHRMAGSMMLGPYDSMLGGLVSAEGEADALYDEDMVNNIVPALAQADQDNVDDGLQLPGPLAPCAPAMFQVQGASSLIAAPPRYINIWADWNADGDWGDTFTCVSPGDASEWVVQNHVLLTPGGFNLLLSGLAYRGGTAGDPLWIRVSIGEQMAPVDPGTGRADGRGPASGYAYGETEDYLYPQTDFQAASPICARDTVTFTHAPASSWAVSFDWDFGDGTVVSNPGPNPSHTYTQAANYTVTLTGTYNANPFSVFAQTVTVHALPVPSFTHDAPVCLGETMHFADTTSGATARAWTFGGAGSQGGTSQNPTYLYSAPGIYTVTLTVTDTNGCASFASQPVVVSDLPTAGFAPSSAEVMVGQPITFTNSSVGASTYQWNFGDGIGSSTAADPTYTYTTSGIYDVTLTASNAYNCTDVYTDTVRVRSGYIYLPLVVRDYTGAHSP